MTMFQAYLKDAKSFLFALSFLAVISIPSIAQENRVTDTLSTKPRTQRIVPNQRDVSGNSTPLAEGGLVDSLRAAGNFTKFLLILDKAGLTETLSDETQSFTMFAPEDKAFTATVRPVALDSLLKDPESAKHWILPYILSGKFTSRDLVLQVQQNKLLTLAGTSLQVSGNRQRDAAGLLVIFNQSTNSSPQSGARQSTQRNRVENAWPCCGRVVSADHFATNGIYHVIDFAGTDGGVWRLSH
jgi:uncharacterized surface protein with fasciclin (FAS1) repeats